MMMMMIGNFAWYSYFSNVQKSSRHISLFSLDVFYFTVYPFLLILSLLCLFRGEIAPATVKWPQQLHKTLVILLRGYLFESESDSATGVRTRLSRCHSPTRLQLFHGDFSLFELNHAAVLGDSVNFYRL